MLRFLSNLKSAPARDVLICALDDIVNLLAILFGVRHSALIVLSTFQEAWRDFSREHTHIVRPHFDITHTNASAAFPGRVKISVSSEYDIYFSCYHELSHILDYCDGVLGISVSTKMYGGQDGKMVMSQWKGDFTARVVKGFDDYIRLPWETTANARAIRSMIKNGRTPSGRYICPIVQMVMYPEEWEMTPEQSYLTELEDLIKK